MSAPSATAENSVSGGDLLPLGAPVRGHDSGTRRQVHPVRSAHEVAELMLDGFEHPEGAALQAFRDVDSPHTRGRATVDAHVSRHVRSSVAHVTHVGVGDPLHAGDAYLRHYACVDPGVHRRSVHLRQVRGRVRGGVLL